MDDVTEKLPKLKGSISRDDFLTASPIADDRGEKVGKLPREIPTGVLRSLGGPHSPIKAIRAKCIDCSGGNAAEARKCTAVGCALWPFRMGHNPFFGKGEAAALGEEAEGGEG